MFNYVCISLRQLVYLNNNMNIPIFEQTSDHYTTKAIVEILLDKHLPLSKIATSQPVNVQSNMVFVVDLSKLSSPEDIRADDLGSWLCNGKRRQQCSVNKFGRVTDANLTINKSRKQLLYTLVKRYYRHATASDYRRVITEIFGEYMYIYVRYLCLTLYLFICRSIRRQTKQSFCAIYVHWEAS